MILKEDQIKDIIINNPNKALLDAARKQAKLYTMYVTGEGLKDSIDKLPYFEKDELTKIRQKLTRTTRDLFERLFQPIEKIWTAKGGITNYRLSTTEESRFGAFLTTVNKGVSIDEWMQTDAQKAYLLDPMSLLYTDIDSYGTPIPCYKSTTVIYDYKLSGRKPEYVVFNVDAADIEDYVASNKIRPLTRGEKLFRVVDDAADMLVIQKAKQVTIEFSVPNFFSYVPGIIASDIPVFGTPYYESPVAPIMELAADFFNDNSSKSLFKKYQMHLKEWGLLIDCRQCDGEKMYKGHECPRCGGSGCEPNIKVAERMNIAVNEDGTAKTPTPPGGYIAPPPDSWTMMNQELDSLKQDMNDTFWGNSKMIKTTGANPDAANQPNTATGEIYNERSKEPKLQKFSKWAQVAHLFVVDNIKKVYYKTATINTSLITYGKRYLLESPDELLTKYTDLKKTYASYPILNQALTETFEATYSSNTNEFRRQEILMRIEPYAHNSLSEVLNMPLVPDDIKAKKMFFPLWLNSTDPSFFYLSSEDVIKKNFEEYVKANLQTTPIVKPEPTITK